MAKGGLLRSARRGVAKALALVAVASDRRSARRTVRGRRGRRTGAHSSAGGYIGARHSREFSDWLVSTISADADLLPDREELIARSRDLCRNNAFARGVLETMVNEIVGCGIRPQCTVDPTEPLLKEVGLTKARARKLKQTTQRDWRRWGRKADITGRNTIGELQAQLMGKILEDGDVFVMFERVEQPGRGYWLGVNVIEAHRVSTPVSKEVDGKRIRDGVELDKTGRPVAIWVELVDESDVVTFNEPAAKLRKWARYDMNDEQGRPMVLHLFRQRRPGQTRGEPLFAPCISLFKNNGEWFDAELLAKKFEACYVGFIERCRINGNFGSRSSSAEPSLAIQS